MNRKSNCKKIKINEMIKDLDKIVRGFEEGNIDIEDGITKYKKAAGIIKQIKGEISSIELKIEKIKKNY